MQSATATQSAELQSLKASVDQHRSEQLREREADKATFAADLQGIRDQFSSQF